jgi:diguanylate cyclase (GGDEF)-like protein
MTLEENALGPFSRQVPVPWLVIALLFYAAETVVIHLHFRREAHTVSLSEFGLVLGLFFLSPRALIAAQLVGSAVSLALHRRQRPLKVAYNLAQFALSTAVAIAVFRSLVLVMPDVGPGQWVAAFAAAAAASLTGIISVTCAIGISEGGVDVPAVANGSAVSLAVTFLNTSLALAAVKLLTVDWHVVPLLVVPCVASVGALRLYAAHRRRLDHLEFLYDSMRTMQRAPDYGSAVHELLVAVAPLLRAEVVEVVLCGADGEHVLRSRIDRGVEELMQPSELSPLEQVAVARFAEGAGAVLLGPKIRHELDGYLAEHGFDDAIVAGLRGEARVIGLLIVGDRAGDVENFTDQDRKLCQTFAAHAAILLENDRLEQSIAELTAFQVELHEQAYHDSLTSLPNRAAFTEAVAAHFALEHSPPPCVLFIDIDDFKTVNDSFGHSTGDQLLKSVAAKIAACVRDGDTPARMGGDEFAILVSPEGANDALDLAQRLLAALRQPIVIGGRPVTLDVSIGVAHAGDHATNGEELLRNADIAMYEAKSAGKRGYAVYEPSLHDAVRRRHELTVALPGATARGELTVHYQPIVDLTTEEVVAFEALARWQHPVYGSIRPTEFIPLAERSGLLNAIGTDLLRIACAQTVRWQEEPGLDQVAITVNIGAAQLQSPNLPAEVAVLLEETGLAPRSLILEVTESSALQRPEIAIEHMHALRALGVRLALDDFGTGYSSLSYLSQLPLDYLKLAKPFVDLVTTNTLGARFVEMIIRLADALEIDPVAEGIERADQAAALKQLGCRLGQGHYLGRPMSAESIGKRRQSRLRLVA